MASSGSIIRARPFSVPVLLSSPVGNGGGEAVYCWTKSYWDDLNQGFCPCWPIEEGLYDEWKPVDARYVNPVTTPTLSCGPPCPYQSTIPHKKTVEIRSDTQRWKQTAADSYYRTYHRLPRPTTMHAVFPQMPIIASSNAQNKKNIFVIGDIHGCYEELQSLIQTAIHQNNDGLPFAAIILVGDLGDKGPFSAQVIRWARTHPDVYAVRGNHDDGALFAALGDPKSRANTKYAWVLEGEQAERDEEKVVLSDDDVTWLAELPYTLTIPGAYLQQPADIIIVHAGLIPNIPLHAQTIPTMITLRELIPVRNTTTTKTRTSHSNIVYEMYEKKKQDHEEHAEGPHPQAWATTWPGPQHVIFGHDAKRGLQTQNSPLALGLDTGAVYGHALTGVLLPARTLVSIPAQHVYCPI